MTSDPVPVAEPGQESVVIASFDDRRRAEYMLASLGRGFRKKARQGRAIAVVVTGNADGSLKLTQSRVLTASDFVGALLGVFLAWTVGLMGLLSILQGAEDEARAAHMRQRHVTPGQHRAHEILAEVGPRGAVALVRCTDPDTRQMVVAAAACRARRSWDGSLTDFLAALDPGSAHDWVRAAVGEPSSTNR